MRTAFLGNFLRGSVWAAVGLLTAAGLSQAATGSGLHYPTNEDLRHVRAMGGPLLSPDGTQVLFSVTEATVDGGKAHLWLAAVGAGAEKARQITFSPPADKRGEHGAAWAPDGTAIYFLAKRGEHMRGRGGSV